MIGETAPVCLECETDDVEMGEHKGDQTLVCAGCDRIIVRKLRPAEAS